MSTHPGLTFHSLWLLPSNRAYDCSLGEWRASLAHIFILSQNLRPLSSFGDVSVSYYMHEAWQTRSPLILTQPLFTCCRCCQLGFLPSDKLIKELTMLVPSGFGVIVLAGWWFDEPMWTTGTDIGQKTLWLFWFRALNCRDDYWGEDETTAGDDTAGEFEATAEEVPREEETIEEDETKKTRR